MGMLALVSIRLGFAGWLSPTAPGPRRYQPGWESVYSTLLVWKAGQNCLAHLATQAQNWVCHIGPIDAALGPCLRCNSIAVPVCCRARVRAAITSRRAQPRRTEQS